MLQIKIISYNVCESGVNDDVKNDDVDEHEAGRQDGGPNWYRVSVHCTGF